MPAIPNVSCRPTHSHRSRAQPLSRAFNTSYALGFLNAALVTLCFASYARHTVPIWLGPAADTPLHPKVLPYTQDA